MLPKSEVKLTHSSIGVVTLVVMATVIGVTRKTNTFTVHACISKKDHRREPRAFTFVCKDAEQANVWYDKVYEILNPPSMYIFFSLQRPCSAAAQRAFTPEDKLI